MRRAVERVGTHTRISSGIPGLHRVQSSAPVSTEPDERNLSADGHDTAVSRALRSIQESHGSDLRGGPSRLCGPYYLFHGMK